MAASLHPFTDPQVVSRQRQFHPVRSERHRLLQSVPVPRNQVSRLQGQRIELLCLRSRRIGHPQLVRCTSDLHSPSPAPPGYGVNSADLSRFYPCTDSTASAVQPTSRTALRCNLANGVLLNSYASVPVSLQVAVPSGYGLSSTDPTRILPLRGCSLHNLRCQRLELLGLQVGRRIPCSTCTAIPILRSSAESQQATGANLSDNTRVYPCSSHCIACSPAYSNCSACDWQPMILPPWTHPSLVPVSFFNANCQTSHLDTVCPTPRMLP